MGTKIIFKDAIYQYPNRYTLTDLGSGICELETNPGTITQEGTLLTAANLNAVADEVIFKLKDTSTSTTAFLASIDGLSTYYEGLTILFKPVNTNTAAATINISNVGVANIKKVDNSGNIVNLEANDLIKNKYSIMTYDGTEFILSYPSSELAEVITDIQNIENKQTSDETDINKLKTEAVRFAISTGSNNAYGVSLNDVADLYSGMVINLVPNVDNTAASTLQVNNLASIAIKYAGNDLIPGMLKSNTICQLIYDGTVFNLQPTAKQVNDLQQDLTTHKADSTTYSIAKSNLDSNGIYTTVQHKRKDGTLILSSVLSGGTSPQYTTRAETYYKTDGTTVDKTATYTITYDTNGMVASEVLQ